MVLTTDLWILFFDKKTDMKVWSDPFARPKADDKWGVSHSYIYRKTLCVWNSKTPEILHALIVFFRWTVSKIIVFADVQVHIERFPIAVPGRCKNIFVERAVHADGWIINDTNKKCPPTIWNRSATILNSTKYWKEFPTYDAGFIAAESTDACAFGWHRKISQSPLRFDIVTKKAHFL